MLAVRHNLITCPHRGCPLPATRMVTFRIPPVRLAGTDRNVEQPAVVLEFCPRHADLIAEQRAEVAAARAAHPSAVGP